MSDYIDRQAAIEAVYAICTVDTEYDAAMLSRLDVRYALEALPSADVEPIKRGRWIEWPNEMECPVCGELWDYCDNDTERFDYCPNCGARMDGEADG